MFHVYVEGPTGMGPEAVQGLADAMAKRYGLSVPELIQRLSKGRFRVKANVDRRTADTYARDLAAIGARVKIEEARPTDQSGTIPRDQLPRTSEPSMPPARRSSPSVQARSAGLRSPTTPPTGARMATAAASSRISSASTPPAGTRVPGTSTPPAGARLPSTSTPPADSRLPSTTTPPLARAPGPSTSPIGSAPGIANPTATPPVGMRTSPAVVVRPSSPALPTSPVRAQSSPLPVAPDAPRPQGSSLPPQPAARPQGSSLPPQPAARPQSSSLPPQPAARPQSSSLPPQHDEPPPQSSSLPPQPGAKPASPPSGLAAAFSPSVPPADLGALDDLTLASLDGVDAPSVLIRPATAQFQPPPGAAAPPAATPSKPDKSAEAPLDLFAPPGAGDDKLDLQLAVEDTRKPARTGPIAVETRAPAAAPTPTLRPKPVTPAAGIATSRRAHPLAPLAAPRVRLAAGVVLAIILGFLPAHLVASLRESSAFRSIDAQVETLQAAATTPEAYDALDAARSDLLDKKRSQRRSIALTSMLLWGLASGGLAYVWFRRVPWDRYS